MPNSLKVPKAFTLVELMIVVAIIGILAALAVPAFRKIQQNSRASAIANDFRVFSEAFLNYNLENGNWPNSDWAEGSYPNNMQSYLSAHWLEPSVAGGYYVFHIDEGAGVPAMVLLSNNGMAEDLMKRVDNILDDGNLNTGRVQGDDQSLDFQIE